MSMNYVSMESDNGLSPVRRQAIIGNNAGILLGEHISMKFHLKFKSFIPENTFENVVCKMSAMLFRP